MLYRKPLWEEEEMEFNSGFSMTYVIFGRFLEA